MKPNYTVLHNFENDCLGNEYRFAVQRNLKGSQIISTTYLENESIFNNENVVAIFRLKCKK
jgi:hypothetical protein